MLAVYIWLRNHLFPRNSQVDCHRLYIIMFFYDCFHFFHTKFLIFLSNLFFIRFYGDQKKDPSSSPSWSHLWLFPILRLPHSIFPSTLSASRIALGSIHPTLTTSAQLFHIIITYPLDYTNINHPSSSLLVPWHHFHTGMSNFFFLIEGGKPDFYYIYMDGSPKEMWDSWGEES